MDEACKYFSEQVANADRMEKLVTMTGFQDSKVYKHFTSQLLDARRMDEKKKFNAQLDLDWICCIISSSCVHSLAMITRAKCTVQVFWKDYT